MTESSQLLPPDASPDGADGDKKRNLIIAGLAAGVLALGGGAFLLMSGGGGTDQAFTPPPKKSPKLAATPTPSPGASAGTQSALPVFKGSVGRDPFEVPARVALALVPAAPAAGPAPAPGGGAPLPAAAAPSPPAAAPPAAAPAPGLVFPTSPAGLPVSQPGPNGTVVTVVPPQSSGTTTPVTVVPQSAQWLQLLAAKKTASGWVVDVRTPMGVTKSVKEATKDIGGTQFFFVGEDEQAGKPTFVFTVGESKGGNLVVNAKEKAPQPGTIPKPDDSTLVLKRGSVDGGIFTP